MLSGGWEKLEVGEARRRASGSRDASGRLRLGVPVRSSPRPSTTAGPARMPPRRAFCRPAPGGLARSRRARAGSGREVGASDRGRDGRDYRAAAGGVVTM